MNVSIPRIIFKSDKKMMIENIGIEESRNESHLNTFDESLSNNMKLHREKELTVSDMLA